MAYKKKMGHSRETVGSKMKSPKGNKTYCPKIDVMSMHSKGAKGMSKGMSMGSGKMNMPKKKM